MKETLLANLARYPLSDFFLRRCVDTMSDKQITDDLAEKPDFSLLLHFDNPDQMGRLEELFAKAMETFHLSREELKAQGEFNFDVYNMEGFESARAVFRLANALCNVGFTQFAILQGEGLADLRAMKDGQLWFVEVKTLILQTKPKEFDVNGTAEIFYVDKFQPETCSTEEYVERISKLIVGNCIETARRQLLDTVRKEGQAMKMVALVLNLLAGDFFLEADQLSGVYARLRGEFAGWEKNYLADVDALAFLASGLHLF